MDTLQQASPVTISPDALQRIASLAREDGREGLKFRLSVTGGGCSGFSYGMSFEPDADGEDLLVELGEVAMLIDPLSLQYLMGVRIDVVENLNGVQFVVDNPNATSTCSCGSSFSA